MPTIVRNQARLGLLAQTQVAVLAAKTVSALVRSGTTATATATAHGFVVGDWVLVAGSSLLGYNGLFQVATVADANTFTYTMEADPGASSAGSVTAQKGVASAIWGDGTSPAGIVTSGGYPGASVGALASSTGGEVHARVATTTAPTTVCRIVVWTSGTAAPGTWRDLPAVDTTILANDQQGYAIPIRHGKFALVFFYRVAGTAVYVDCVAHEDTSYTSGS